MKNYNYYLSIMADKEHCYYIIPRIPYPPVGGDRLKYFNSIKVLSPRLLLHIIVISDEKLDVEAEKFLKENSASYKVFTFSKIRFRANAFRGLFSNAPVQVNYYFFKKVHTWCKATIKPGDIVIANLIRTALYAIDLPNRKIINFEDSIYLNYKASIKKVSSFFWKVMYAIELNRLKRFEERCIANFSYATFVNIHEQQYYGNYTNTAWLPNGVNNELCERVFDAGLPRTNEVAYLGKMDYQPNVDAVVWFAEQVVSRYTGIKLRIIGAKPNKRVLNLQKKYPGKISITGYVDDPFAIMKSSLAVVAPMQTGGGIQNKILEAMAIGCVVLTSSLGSSPIIGAENLKHLVICNTPEDYVAIIQSIQDDAAAATEISGNARQFIKHYYTWNIYGNKLFALIDELSR